MSPRSAVKSPKPRSDFFTPAPVVHKMSGLCEPLLSDPSRKVFEPGCGTGNFLVEALSRRLQKLTTPHEALIALSNLYGVDINPDYLAEARVRLKSILLRHFSNQPLDYRFLPLVDLFLRSNLIQGDLIRNYEDLVFIDWQLISDYNFRAVPARLGDMLKNSISAANDSENNYA